MNKDYSNQFNKNIILKEKGKFKQIEMEKIIKISCEGYISTIKTIDSEISISKILKKFEGELKNYGFIRVNRNNLVNFKHIKNYSKINSKPTITLSNNEKLIISRRNLPKLMTFIRNQITIY